MKYKNPDQYGYYGDFGGAFIPEMLYPNVKELEDNYLDIINSDDFRKEYNALLKDYVGGLLHFILLRISAINTRQIYILKEKI